MNIGDLIEYTHDGSRGMVIDKRLALVTSGILDTLLVLWSPEVSERYQLDRAGIWWVDVDSVEVIK